MVLVQKVGYGVEVVQCCKGHSKTVGRRVDAGMHLVHWSGFVLFLTFLVLSIGYFWGLLGFEEFDHLSLAHSRLGLPQYR